MSWEEGDPQAQSIVYKFKLGCLEAGTSVLSPTVLLLWNLKQAVSPEASWCATTNLRHRPVSACYHKGKSEVPQGGGEVKGQILTNLVQLKQWGPSVPPVYSQTQALRC